MEGLKKGSFGRLLGAVFGLLLLAGLLAYAQRGQRARYTATALTEGAFMPGRFLDIDVTIWQQSTEADQRTLIQAFEKAGQQGLVNALSRMSAKGHVDIPGTVGYDLSYVRVFPAANGQKIRMVSNRPIRFGEAWTDSRSMDYDLGMMELDINNADSSSSGGMVIFAARLKVENGKLTIESYGSGPYKIVRVKSWN